MEQTVLLPDVRKYSQVREATNQGEKKGQEFFWMTIKSPPEVPGLSRPVWLTIAASVPTALGWYGWYKFSVEEELFYDELRREGRVTGPGGYGTLVLFSWCIVLGGLGGIIGLPGAENIIEAGAIWILLSQVNLYLRVNKLMSELPEGEPPLHAWWALLPPPLDLIVGLRQVHFLAKYWCSVRGDEWRGDQVAEEYFPFISAPRFTIKEFIRSPSMWFWFTKNWSDLDLPFLAENRKYPMSERARNDLGWASRTSD